VEDVRKVIGCAASPIRVTVPLWLSHASVGQYESLLCQERVSSGIDWNIALKGSAYSLPLSLKSSTILGPLRLGRSCSDAQVCITMKVHSPGLRSSCASCTIKSKPGRIAVGEESGIRARLTYHQSMQKCRSDAKLSQIADAYHGIAVLLQPAV
jgi:hypothetical protein